MTANVKASEAAQTPIGRPECSLFEFRRLIESLGLHRTTRAVLEQIYDAGESCFARQDKLSERCGITDRSFRTHVGRLVDLGLVIKAGFNGRRVKYVVDWQKINEEIGGAGRKKFPGRSEEISGQVGRSFRAGRKKFPGALDSKSPLSNPPYQIPPTNAVCVDDSFKRAARMAADWYGRLGRVRPSSDAAEVSRLAEMIGRYGLGEVESELKESIDYVRHQFTACQFLSGVLNRIQSRIEARSLQSAARAAELERQAVDRAIERRKEDQIAEEKRRKRAFWDSLSDEERAGRLAATRAGFPKSLSPNEWLVEVQTIAEAWEDHLAAGGGRDGVH